MAHHFVFKALLLCIILFAHNQQCASTELFNTILTAVINSANELNRIFQLLYGRDDFNRYFSSREWTLENRQTDDEYDFIIVGSGSAGSVIANRLSEIKQWKILLLECGIQETYFMDVPVFAPMFQFTPYNWGYLMEHQKDNFFGLNNNRMHWPRGRCLGGTSCINYMIYTRGSPYDFDRWAAQGNPGWSYDEILPYYIKSERARLTGHDPNFHDTDGYQPVENIYYSKLTEAYLEAGPKINLTKSDYNAVNNSQCVGRIQATVKNGRRHSTATSFLYPVRKRKNLHIITKAFVTKILIDPTTKVAYGVAYDKNGKSYRVRARKEVILSAGTFNSPQLLMLSGIGPREHLEEMGIPVLKDAQVGMNLKDHLTFPGLAFEINQPIDLNFAKVLLSLGPYLKNGTGPPSSLGGVEAIGYIKTPAATYFQPYPDMELLFVGSTLAGDYGLVTYRGMNIRDEVFQSLFSDLLFKHAWTIFPMLLHPKSTGYLKLRSTNPYDYPKLYGNFFTDPDNNDIKTFIAAIRIIQEMAKTEPFQKYGSKLNTKKMATCEHLDFDTDPYWECCLRSISVTLHHQIGTARMGPTDDPEAVVSPRLKVYGIGNLRVADSSIIPVTMGAHMNAPAMMIGEVASDKIKEDYGLL